MERLTTLLLATSVQFTLFALFFKLPPTNSSLSVWFGILAGLCLLAGWVYAVAVPKPSE
ncbi:hypothetical protein [Halorubrum sp. Atlit-28R]|jgi:hypothetical protein|uniref:hypothetical protein n=1 Tax=Halorubrum sp. Atlit-28R TaxID=2282129 RepID=UPI001314E1E8|nr:hypothetical protein [Halorubrum sp. Atlit-28R]